MTSKSELHFWAEETINSLVVLSADHTLQIDYLERNYSPVDELGLEFGDCTSFKQFWPQSWTSNSDFMAKIFKIDELLAKWSGPAHVDGVWSYYGLEAHEVWEKIRPLAQAALADLGLQKFKKIEDLQTEIIFCNGNQNGN